jgi:DNA mismatch repair protein MutL
MGKIRELSPAMVNLIAAGEVVERPASAAKELLENAIDAGATRVELTVERGGKDLVRVSDNGSGIARDDLPLAFRPHATSKLAEADDLNRIRSLGFRGEALAAIAEVSRVTCRTRTADEESGTEFTVEAGVAAPARDAAAPVGTTIDVRNLFFNTPVRRQYLRSDATEASHVSDTFARVALAHPDVHMTFRSGGRVLYDLPAAAGLRERIATFFGQELADALLWVENRTGPIHVRGYVGHPSQSRSSNKTQFLFVGGRYVRDRSLSHALAEAYRGLIMVGRYPVTFLFLDLPPDQVDVNVHPTKIEVRFRDGHAVYSQLLASIRQTFLASDLHTRLQAPPVTATITAASGSAAPPPSTPAPTSPNQPEPAFQLSSLGDRRQEVASWFQPSAPSPSFTTRPEPEWVGSLPPRPEVSAPDRIGFDEFDAIPGEPPEPTTASSPPAPTPSSLHSQTSPTRAIQVHDTYLIVETDDGMVVIDQHALHERILYEELRARLDREGIESQRLLVPEPVDLGAGGASELLERRDVLARLGLDVQPSDGETLSVASIPAMLRHVPVDRLIRDLADHFRSTPLDPQPDAVLEDVLNMIACKAAIKAGQALSAQEIDTLLQRRHLVLNTHHCPHGRPTALTFTRAELERQFGRTAPVGASSRGPKSV